MGTITRKFSVNYKGIEANELFFVPIFTDIMQLGDFTIMPDVVYKRKMQFVNTLEKIVQKNTGCGFTPSGDFGISEREVDVDEIKVNIEQCYDEFKNTVLQEKLKKGNMKFNMTGTEIFKYLIQKVKDATMLDYMRLFWFGDKTSVDPAYNVTDGIWSVHIPALVAATAIPYTNTASGAPLNPGDGENYLRTVYDAAPLPLKGLPTTEKVFLVSGSVYEQYREDLENSGGGDAGRQLVIDGAQVLSFRGIAVKPQWNWDVYTAADLSLPDYHQILYTSPKNLIFATDLFSTMSQVGVFYDELEEKTYVKVNGKMGTNYVHPSLFSVGY